MNKKQSNFRKFVSQLWDKIDKPDVLSQTEQLAFDIFKISLEDDNNVRFLSSKNLCKKYILTKSYLKMFAFLLYNR